MFQFLVSFGGGAVKVQVWHDAALKLCHFLLSFCSFLEVKVRVLFLEGGGEMK